MLNGICSVVVSCNYGAELLQSISMIYQQSYVVWIDNSTDDKNQDIEQIILLECPNIVYRKNIQNIGLSKSYNIALEIAKANGAAYFATFDQDTLIERDTLIRLVELMEKYQLDSIGPNYGNSRSQSNEISRTNFLISSCNLTRISVFESIKYDERFFIDSVDLEFCLAMKASNFEFRKANFVKIKHQIGEKYRGRFGICFQAHAPERYYYIYRNYHYLKKLYRDTYIVKLGIRLCFVRASICLFFRTEDRKRAMAFIREGVVEGKKL